MSESPLVLEEFLPYRLSVLSNRLSAAIAESYSRRFGLSIPEWRVIAVLARAPGISAAEVAERTAMDKVAVSRAVRRLLHKGRIRRETATGDPLCSLHGKIVKGLLIEKTGDGLNHD